MSALDIQGIKKPVAALYPVVEELRCVELQIPNDDGYLWVLAGFVSILGQSWSWLGDKSDRLERARLWIKAYEATDWMQCMNCEQLIECITPLFDAQTAEIQRLINYSKYGDLNQPGVPLPDEVTAADQAAGTNPTCNLDITWAQCLQLVQYANQLIVDALEKIEVATNDIELLHVITEITGIDEASADAVVGYINLLQEGLSENYVAQYTETYEQEAACAIFCLAQLDCEISLDDIYSVFYDRVVAHFGSPGEAIQTLADLLLRYLSAQEITGTTICDVLMVVVWGGGVLANLFLGDVGTKSLKALLTLAVNDASSDWMTLCDDCPEPVTPEIGVTECYPGELGGTDIVSLGDNRWRVSTTGAEGHRTISIVASDGSPFTITDPTFSPDGQSYSAWEDAEHECHDDFIPPYGQPVYLMVWIWGFTLPAQTIEFTMLPA